MRKKFVYFAVNCRTTSEITDFDTLFSMIKIFTSLSVYTHVVLQCSLLLLSSVVKVAPIMVRKENKMSVYFRLVFLAAGYTLQRGVVSIERYTQSICRAINVQESI